MSKDSAVSPFATDPNLSSEVIKAQRAFEELGGDGCLKAWRRLRASNGGQLLQGIESESLSSNLISEHDSLFIPKERDNLSTKRELQTCLEVVDDSLKRDPIGVLCAFYKALIATRKNGGATQHVKIAKQIVDIAQKIREKDDSDLPHGTMESDVQQDDTTDSSVSKAVLSSSSTTVVTPSPDSKQVCHTQDGALNRILWSLEPMKTKLQVILSILHYGNIYISGIATEDTPYSRHIQEFCLATKKWSTLPEAPNHNAPIVVIDGYITLLGGRDRESDKLTNIVSFWNGHQWKKMQLSLPLPVLASGVCLCDDLLLVSGGAVNSTKDTSDAYDEKFTVVKTVHAYNFRTKEWSIPHALQLPIPLRSHHLVRHGEYIYLLAGALTFPAKSEAGDKYFNPQAWRARWSNVTEAVAVATKKNATGGVQATQSVWTPIAGPPALRSTIACSEISKSLISVGGQIDGSPQNTVYKFIDDNTGSPYWKECGCMSEGRYRHAAVFVGNLGAVLFAAGGYVSTKPSEDENNVKSASAELVVL